MSTLKNQDVILTEMFSHYITLKMYHFQTKLYGAHKASDAYVGGFLINFDKFMEVSQGTFKTVSSKTLDIKAGMVTDVTVFAYLDTFIDFLNQFEKLLGKGQYSDLYNIRDEMKADANQLKYLLRFEWSCNILE